MPERTGCGGVYCQFGEFHTEDTLHAGIVCTHPGAGWLADATYTFDAYARCNRGAWFTPSDAAYLEAQRAHAVAFNRIHAIAVARMMNGTNMRCETEGR